MADGERDESDEEELPEESQDVSDQLASTSLKDNVKEEDVNADIGDREEDAKEELEDERIRVRTTTDLLDLLIAETPKTEQAEGKIGILSASISKSDVRRRGAQDRHWFGWLS